MPYLSCPRCGLRTYCVSGEECPRCGTSLGGPPRSAVRPREGPMAAADRAGPIERLLAMAQHELRMDAAVLSEARDGREVVVSAVSNGRVPGVARGASAPLDETICRRLLEGTIGGVVHDAAVDEELCELPPVRRMGLRAYIGVPVDVSALRDYVLCCIALDARPDLGEADVRFL
ncbi:MAG: hypothetical protein QOH46_3599, partial [Solirubrobacteraceae bacterium]|nr:hypothetical protein [Solirubrobacteraceae bacterium]